MPMTSMSRDGSQPASQGLTDWTVIVPVKRTTIAKSRLVAVSPAVRRQLAVAFALDTVAAALACRAVTGVVVVTDDPIGERFAAMGARVVPDVPDAGLNPALSYAAELIRADGPDAAIAAMSSDLPALWPDDLERALEAGRGRWFVSDAEGTGTTLVGCAPNEAWTPRFGPDSRSAHLDAGMVELQIDGLARLRRDVDTADDLAAAIRLGVGPQTAALTIDLAALR
jgi:2-phospho-L-lactate/phosphoenolpyruvate guanylyltransferase